MISSDLATAKSNFQAGCSAIAAAITAMGVSTASNATPAVMAANIKKLCNPSKISIIGGNEIGFEKGGGCSTSVTIPAGVKHALVIFGANIRAFNITGETASNATLSRIGVIDMEADVIAYLVTLSGAASTVTITGKNDYYGGMTIMTVYKLD